MRNTVGALSSSKQSINSSRMSSLFHLTYTRFQIEGSGKTKNEEWKGFSRITDFEDLQYAITVFLNITLYSILKGKAKPDLYLILIPPDLPIELLKSKTRKREVVQARQISMYFSKKMTKSSLANIGAHCGGKDHATVLHACRTVTNLSETDKHFRAYLEDLEKKLTIQ